MALEDAINREFVCLSDQTPVGEVVQKMIDEKVSTILVHDQHNEVVGIITERDIVHKLTLLEVPEKFEKPVNTLMTRPVHFAKANDLFNTVLALYKEYGVRHFPVAKGDQATVESMVGIVSISKFYKELFESREVVSDEVVREEIPLMVLSSKLTIYHEYERAFGGLNFKVRNAASYDKFIRDSSKEAIWPSLLFDSDGFSENDMRSLLPKVKRYPGPLIIASSLPQLVQFYRKYLDSSHQVIKLKPLEVDYIDWLLRERWRVTVAPPTNDSSDDKPAGSPSKAEAAAEQADSQGAPAGDGDNDEKKD